jgi:hypothetical protein
MYRYICILYIVTFVCVRVCVCACVYVYIYIGHEACCCCNRRNVAAHSVSHPRLLL